MVEKGHMVGYVPDDRQGFAGRAGRAEKDPHGMSAGAPGAKLDAGKSPVFQGTLQYFPRALLAVADLSAAGAAKYSWKGWEKVPDGENRYGNAMGRHILKEAIEGEYDSEFPGKEILHATEQAWNALARLELMLRRKAEPQTYEPVRGWEPLERMARAGYEEPDYRKSPWLSRDEQMDPAPLAEHKITEFYRRYLDIE